MAGSDNLNAKQKRFCREYLIDSNATQAAIRAGYSKKAAQPVSSRLLSNAMVKAHIAELTKPVVQKLELTAERVLLEIKRLAYADPQSYYKKNAKGQWVIKELDELTEDQSRAIRHVNIVAGKIVGYELYNKDPSLDKLGKNLKLFTELNETVHSFNMMGDVKVASKEGKKAATVKATLTFEVGEQPRVR